jgi:hypothetical protein
MPKQATKHTTQSKPKAAGRSAEAAAKAFTSAQLDANAPAWKPPKPACPASAGARTAGARILVLGKVEASLVALLCAALVEGAGRCRSRKEQIERFAGGGCRIRAKPTGDPHGTWAVQISAADSVSVQAAEFKIKELAKGEEGRRAAREARSASRLLMGAYGGKQVRRSQQPQQPQQPQQQQAVAPAALRQEDFPALGGSAMATATQPQPPTTQAAATEEKPAAAPSQAAPPQAARVASFFASFSPASPVATIDIDTATETLVSLLVAPPAPPTPPPRLSCPTALAKPEVRRTVSAWRWGDLDETPRGWGDDETPRTPQAA